jgi:hypothetical protein
MAVKMILSDKRSSKKLFKFMIADQWFVGLCKSQRRPKMTIGQFSFSGGAQLRKERITKIAAAIQQLPKLLLAEKMGLLRFCNWKLELREIKSISSQGEQDK